MIQRQMELLAKLPDPSLRDDTIVTGYETVQPEIRIKVGPFRLEMQTRVDGLRWSSQYSVLRPGGQRMALTGAEWADLDQSGRIVLARNGKLLAAEAQPDATLSEYDLAEFCDAEFTNVEPPGWARKW